MAEYKTYKKEKWLYFSLAFAAYFLPMIVVISVFFPIMEIGGGAKVGMGAVLIVVNSIPFLKNIFSSFLVHFPLFNVFCRGVSCGRRFFATDFFQYYVNVFMWIEFAAVVGSVLACVFWAKYRKYSQWRESVKAVGKSGILGAIK